MIVKKIKTNNTIKKRYMEDIPYWLMAFLTNLIIASFAIVPYIIKGHGAFALSNDFSAETIPFGMLINKAYKSGEILWNSYIDLGSNFLESLNGYNSSPFLILQLLFPADFFPYIIGWIIIFKYSIAGLTSSLYLNRYTKKKYIVIIGSILYTFSSFQCTTIIFQFQDMVALFPLMLYSLEIFMEEKKKTPFIFACVLNCLCSVVGFVGIAFFLIIYFLIRYAIPQIKKNMIKGFGYMISNGVKLSLLAIISMSTIAIWVIPTIINLLGNTRASNRIICADWFNISTNSILMSIKSFFLPAEPMNYYFTVAPDNWMTNAAYIPLFGLTLVIAYIISNKGWLRNLVLLLLVMAIIPVLNSVFYLFAAEPYHRWYYMLTLIFALISCKVLENIEDYKILHAMIITFLVLCFYVYIVKFSNYNGDNTSIIYNNKGFFYSVLYAFCGLVAVGALYYVIVSNKHNLICEKLVVLCVGIFSVIQLFTIINQYQNHIDNTDKDFNSYHNNYSQSVVNYLTDVSNKLDNDIGAYRYYFDENIGYTYYNIGMTNSLPTINSFISTLSNSIFDFYKSIDSERGTMTPFCTDKLLNLLGVKYIVCESGYEDYPIIKTFVNQNGQKFYLKENLFALPIGFGYDTYITKNEFNNLDTTDAKVAAMITSMVIDDEIENKVSSVLKHLDIELNNDSLNSHLREQIEKRQDDSCENYQKGINSFSVNYYTEQEKYVFFSVPYEKWWKATVNGESADILDINGLMAVKVGDGKNEICFTYVYYPFYVGLAIAIVGIVISIVILFLEIRKYSLYSIAP